MASVIDLFAGPGGWDLGARALGLDPIGIELDDAACATRRAAGLRTLQGDVAALDPRDVVTKHIDARQRPPRARSWVHGLIASPPCQSYSMAGKGGGRRDKEHVVRCAGELAAGSDTRAEHAARCEDPRSMLVVEPLRWALALKPEWLAFEQVPPVLELWSMFAQILALRGYSTWTGVLEFERYGVPQTRDRAVLIARRSGAAQPPRPTHQRYVKGEPQRYDHTMEGEILPWVSMAEALGWSGTGIVQTGNFSAVERDADGGRSAAGSVPYERDIEAPAPVVTGNSDRWKIVGLRAGTNENDIERAITEPAPTLRFGERGNAVDWIYDRRQTGGDGTPVGPRPAVEPAPTTTATGLASGRDVWVGEDGIRRITIEEAAVLQSFPIDHPWRGSPTQQRTQVGNAVPPLGAQHILSAVTGIAIPSREEAAA